MSCTRKDHNAVTPVRLESVALRSRVKNSEPLRSPSDGLELSISVELVTTCAGKNQKNICTGTYLCWEEPKEHVTLIGFIHCHKACIALLVYTLQWTNLAQVSCWKKTKERIHFLHDSYVLIQKVLSGEFN